MADDELPWLTERSNDSARATEREPLFSEPMEAPRATGHHGNNEGTPELPPWLSPDTETQVRSRRADAEQQQLALDPCELTTSCPPSPAKCCAVCGDLYSGAVCRCAQLAMQHPISKTLARVRIGQQRRGSGGSDGSSSSSDGGGTAPVQRRSLPGPGFGRPGHGVDEMDDELCV